MMSLIEHVIAFLERWYAQYGTKQPCNPSSTAAASTRTVDGRQAEQCK
jgi:hypothetical protein